MGHHHRTAEQLAEFALGLRYAHLPASVRVAAKTHLLDTIGVALAACPLPSSRQVQQVASRWGGTPEATLWGLGVRVPSPAAALVNGTLAHSLDFDDTHLTSITHPSACVLPAALAAAEAAGADGERLLASIVAGYEVTARIGLAAAGAFHKRGFHATPLCGAFGAAAAAGALVGLDVDQMVSAFGIVASQAAGIQAFVDEGAWTKRIHPGWAALSAIVAVQLAQVGFVGPRRGLDSRYGFFSSHVGPDAFDLRRVVDGLGDTWETAAIALKPYPCCHFNHSCMDAALRLQKEYGFGAADIREIEAFVPAPVMQIVCKPPTVKAAPPTPYGALFSLPFCVAFVIVNGSFGVSDVNEATIRDRCVLDVAARVRCQPLTQSQFPATYPGRIRMHLHDGRMIEREEFVNRGHPDNSLCHDDVLAKFRSAAAHGAPAERISAIIVVVERLERGSINTLIAALSVAV